VRTVRTDYGLDRAEELREDLVTVLEHRHRAVALDVDRVLALTSGRAVAIELIRVAAPPLLHLLQSLAVRLVGKNTANFEDPDLMAGYVADIERVLPGVLGIGDRNLPAHLALARKLRHLWIAPSY
jgi:hypothetical protein